MRMIDEELILDKYLDKMDFKLVEWKVRDAHSINLARGSLSLAELKKMSSENVAQDQDPYEILGFGFVSLFWTMRYLALIFFAMATVILTQGIFILKSH